MKKLGKILINPEKVIKNEELLNLRGGYDIEGCPCYVSCKVTGGSCGGFWTDNCDDPRNMERCELIPSCINLIGYACV